MAHFQTALVCCAALGQRLHLKNDGGCQSRLISQSVVSERDGFLSLTPGPGFTHSESKCRQSGR